MKPLTDYIVVLDDVLPTQICDNLVSKFENILNRNETTHTHYDWIVDGEPEFNNFDELNISNLQPIFQEEHDYIFEVTPKAIEAYKDITKSKFFPQEYNFEKQRMKKYTANRGDKFGWHSDAADKVSGERFLVCFYYLNDVVEGGTTDFEFDGEIISVEPKKGRLVMFPPMWMYPHIGNVPISNDKYILSTYAHYK